MLVTIIPTAQQKSEVFNTHWERVDCYVACAQLQLILLVLRGQSIAGMFTHLTYQRGHNEVSTYELAVPVPKGSHCSGRYRK